MKRTKLVFSLLVCLLTLGLIFVSCNSETKDNPVPHLNDICIIISNSSNNQWIPTTTVAINDPMKIGIKGTDSDRDIKTVYFKITKNTGTGGHSESRNVSWQNNPFEEYPIIGSWSRSPGDYTLEVWVVDAKKNESNHKKIKFTITTVR